LRPLDQGSISKAPQVGHIVVTDVPPAWDEGISSVMDFLTGLDVAVFRFVCGFRDLIDLLL
jgi:hypothetical protein